MTPPNPVSTAKPTVFRCGSYTLSLSRPLIMGIVNVTPDSFSDGGAFLSPQAAIRQGFQLLEEGADILDVGGESTRPGARPVDEAEELERVLPVLKGLRGAGRPVAVDTMKPAVMRAVLGEGASIINDVNALRAPGAIEVVAASSAGACLMHMKGEPRTMQEAPQYDDVVAEVRAFLAERVAAARAAGIEPKRLAVDPGFGFGKNLRHNLDLVRNLPALASVGTVLFGASRKASLGLITGKAVDQRLQASVAIALMAVERGAAIVRVHDVAATRDALAVWKSVTQG